MRAGRAGAFNMSTEHPQTTPKSAESSGPALLPTHLPDRFSQTFFRVLFRVLFACLGGLKVRNAGSVPRTGPVMFCPNHISDADPIALYTVIPRNDVYYMGKQELFDIKPGNFFRYHGGFPVKRNTADRAALRTGEAMLKAGQGLVLFPEGGISATGLIRPLLPGAAMIAINAHATIVPMGIIHTRELLPYGKVVPRRSRNPVTVIFGEPIRMAEFESLPQKAKIAAITQRIEVDIRRLTDQPRVEEPTSE